MVISSHLESDRSDTPVAANGPRDGVEMGQQGLSCLKTMSPGAEWVTCTATSGK